MPDATLALPGIETPPTSLRMAVGSAVWGIDPSTHRIALGVVAGQGDELPPELGWFSLDVPSLDKGARRLERLRELLVPWFAQYAAVAPPWSVGVEQPFGQGKARPHPQSYYVVAIVLSALAHVLPEGSAQIGVIEPSTWKKEALGDRQGFAKKSDVLRWAQAHGYPGDCPKCHGLGSTNCEPQRAHDEADCLGVATAVGVRWKAGRPLR